MLYDQDNEGFEEDVLATFKRNGVEVIFIKCAEGLLDRPFECITWHNDRMIIGIDEDYLTNHIDEYVNGMIQAEIKLIPNHMNKEEVVEPFYHDLTVKYFTDVLKQLVTMVMLTSNPEDTSIDRALEDILDSEI